MIEVYVDASGAKTEWYIGYVAYNDKVEIDRRVEYITERCSSHAELAAVQLARLHHPQGVIYTDNVAAARKGSCKWVRREDNKVAHDLVYKMFRKVRKDGATPIKKPIRKVEPLTLELLNTHAKNLEVRVAMLEETISKLKKALL